jgi:hypothetical protein
MSHNTAQIFISFVQQLALSHQIFNGLRDVVNSARFLKAIQHEGAKRWGYNTTKLLVSEEF